MERLNETSVSSPEDWQRTASTAFVPLSITAKDRPFTARIRSEQLSPAFSVAHVKSGPVTVERRWDQVRRDHHDDLLLTIQLGAASTVIQHDRVALLRPGAATLYETDHPYTLAQPDEDQDLLVLRVSRDAVSLPRPSVTGLCARTIDAQTPGLGALRGFARGLIGPTTSGPLSVGTELGSLGTQLVQVVLRAFQQRSAVGWDSSAALLTSVTAYISEHLGDPDLTVNRLAAVHYVSVRRIHQLFEELDDTPAAYIRRSRLDLAARILRGPSQELTTVGMIARHCGFKDPSTFTRAFVREYGVPPTLWAAEQRSS